MKIQSIRQSWIFSIVSQRNELPENEEQDGQDFELSENDSSWAAQLIINSTSVWIRWLQIVRRFQESEKIS